MFLYFRCTVGEEVEWCASMQVRSLENVWNLSMLFERRQHETLSINESLAHSTNWIFNILLTVCCINLCVLPSAHFQPQNMIKIWGVSWGVSFEDSSCQEEEILNDFQWLPISLREIFELITQNLSSGQHLQILLERDLEFDASTNQAI